MFVKILFDKTVFEVVLSYLCKGYVPDTGSKMNIFRSILTIKGNKVLKMSISIYPRAFYLSKDCTRLMNGCVQSKVGYKINV